TRPHVPATRVLQSAPPRAGHSRREHAARGWLAGAERAKDALRQRTRLRRAELVRLRAPLDERPRDGDARVPAMQSRRDSSPPREEAARYAFDLPLIGSGPFAAGTKGTDSRDVMYIQTQRHWS